MSAYIAWHDRGSDEYASRMEWSAGKMIYLGECLPGKQLSPDEPWWRIRKYIYSGDDLVQILWADGTSAFNKIWDDRATYTY
jgi:hypothetical protein